ncbi:MAG: hypothetical protein JWM59_5073 [Verrucomicrobiales bacterium]|nr:hypothetical protein [Verrucomicrobiales bacterium]
MPGSDGLAGMNFPPFCRRAALGSFTAAALCLICPLPAEDSAGAAVSLFNGRDLTGWKAPDAETFWKISEGGVLTGENNAAKKGSVLETVKSYADFDLEADVRWSGEIDSGFILRKPELQLQIGVSRSLKKDMTGCFYTGGAEKYPQAGQAADRDKLVKPGEWNHFRLVAKGDTFTVWINGKEAVSYRNALYPGAAPLGLQIHPGLPMKVEFRNLTLKELK